MYNFTSTLEDSSFYIKKFEVNAPKEVVIGENHLIHMRIDPPFDSRYQRYLWMLNALKERGAKVSNDPSGIMLHNEKLFPLKYDWSLPNFIGHDFSKLKVFLKENPCEEYVLKPLDLFQGLGVEKIHTDDLEKLEQTFIKKVKENNGPIVAQPFLKEIVNGEVRAVYFKGLEIGTILKIPPKDSFLANIAGGATYKKFELTKTQQTRCEEICKELASFGIDLVAFDILGNYVSEVNITCPGLLVEVSTAMEYNLAEKFIY